MTLNASSRHQIPISETDKFSSDNEMGSGIVDRQFKIKTGITSAYHKQGSMYDTISRRNQ